MAEQRLPERIAKLLRELQQAHAIPAVGFGYVRAGRVAMVTALGYADVAERRAATADTVFHLASVSKVFTGTALMQLAEAGRFELEDAVEPHLDFSVRNPLHSQPITFRQVLTHTSSISDANYGTDLQGNGDPAMGLRDFLTGYLAPGGGMYSASGSYTAAAPGERYLYSNVGAALAGYLAERVARTPLRELTDRTLFRPLKMRPVGWRLADLRGVPLATPYTERDGRLVAIPQIGYPDWPAGLLRATTRGVTRFVAAFANAGAYEGSRVLQASTVAEMIRSISPPPLPTGHVRAQGLFWEEFVSPTARIIGKSGTDPGTHNLIAFNPATRDGVVLLTNRSTNGAMNEAMMRVVTTLLA